MGSTAGARTHTVSERKENAKDDTQGPKGKARVGKHCVSELCVCA